MEKIQNNFPANHNGLAQMISRTGSFKAGDIFYRIVVLVIGFSMLGLVVIMKSKSTVSLFSEPLFFTYSIFVTAFELSRIISAMLYEKSFASIFHLPAEAKQKDDYQPAVTFIIPCKNEEKVIAQTVKHCYEADYPREKKEIIVINDGSTDRTEEILEELKSNIANFKVINWSINRGKRQAMAEGFRMARGEIVVQLDSDSYIDPKTFRQAIVPFANDQIGAVCSHADPQNAGKNILTKMQAAYYFMSFRVLKAAESTFFSVFCLSGCSSVYRKSAVIPVIEKWKNEKFLGRPVTWGDDRALTSWLLKSGYKTVYTDQSQAYTIVPENLRQLLKQQLRWKKSWIVNAFFTSRFIWKEQPFVSLIYYFPLLFVSFLTPFMAMRSLVYLPATHGILPLYHIVGVILITALFAFYCLVVSKKKNYIPYLFLWSIFSLFVLSFVMVWAAVRIQDRGWGTR
jgi:hyaluronan synthase